MMFIVQSVVYEDNIPICASEHSRARKHKDNQQTQCSFKNKTCICYAHVAKIMLDIF